MQGAAHRPRPDDLAGVERGLDVRARRGPPSAGRPTCSAPGRSCAWTAPQPADRVGRASARPARRAAGRPAAAARSRRAWSRVTVAGGSRQTASAVRAEDWDERYAERQQWSAEPNALVAELLAGLPPGDAVDLAAGEGRHALWLAAPRLAGDGGRLLRGRPRPRAAAGRAPSGVTWVTADVLDLVGAAGEPRPGAGRLPAPARGRHPGRPHPGGRLAAARRPAAGARATTSRTSPRGVGGPQEPAILHSVDRLAPVAALLDVDRLEQVRAGDPGRARRWTPCCGDADRPERPVPAVACRP